MILRALCEGRIARDAKVDFPSLDFGFLVDQIRFIIVV